MLTTMKKEVLFVCTHNSARSQMAEGLMNTLYPNSHIASSAGVVATEVNSYAIRVMQEIGIDITRHRSKSIEEFRGRSFDIVVTVCDSAKESCPFFPGKRVIHKAFPDPSDVKGNRQEIVKKFREVRDDIKEWLGIELGGQPVREG
jgi:arsenate reductase